MISEPNTGERPKSFRLGAGLIVLIALLVYIPAMRAGFVWDDSEVLTASSLIRAKDGIFRIWFTKDSPNYWPVTWSSFWLEWRLWGMNAAGYHVVNVLLHAASAVLIWRILKRLKIPGAWAAALIFAVHPVNVASVAWIAERKNTLSMLFYALAILWYLQFDDDGDRRWYFLSLGSFLLALLSKTSVVMLPFVLLGCAWWRRGRIGRKDLLRVIPFFALSGIMGLVTVWFESALPYPPEVAHPEGFFARLAGAGWAVWFYIYKAALPLNLSMVYPRWWIDPASPIVYLPGLLLLVCLGLCLRFRRSVGRPVLFGLGYFVVTLFPVMGFFTTALMADTLVADHWQYVSIIGIIALAVGAGATLYGRLRPRHRQWLLVATAALVGALSVLTWQQTRVYESDETLWRDTIAKDPRCWVAHVNLGRFMFDRKRHEEAITRFRASLRIMPEEEADTPHSAMRRPVPITYIGMVLLERGETDEAISHLREALRVRPTFVLARENLAVALLRQDRVAEAMAQHREVLRIRPNWLPTLNDLAWILATHENPEFRDAAEAVRLAEHACELSDYENAVSLDTLAAAYAEAGRFPEAVRIARKALALASEHETFSRHLRHSIKLYEASRPFRRRFVQVEP